MADKQCWSCKVVQAVDNFSRNRSKSSGRSAECKSCVAAYNKRHVADNAVYYRAYRQAKRKHNLAWYLFLECRTRAKRNGLEFNLQPADIIIPSACPVFGFVLEPGQARDHSASVDRIDSAKGYVRGNIRVISYLANRMKSNATASQLVIFAQWILEGERHGTERRLDAGQSKAAHTNQHAGEAPYRSRTWSCGDERIAGDGDPDPVAQITTRSECH